MGAEEEEYQLTLDDVDSCLVYMYTPVTEEGAKGEPQYAITDYVKAGMNVIDVVFILSYDKMFIELHLLLRVLRSLLMMKDKSIMPEQCITLHFFPTIKHGCILEIDV